MEKRNLGGNPDALTVAMQQAKLVDLAHARRILRDDPTMGQGRLARALGCGYRTAVSVMRGVHWQQDPQKVKIFNKLNGCRIPENGEPDEVDLMRFGPSEEDRLENAVKLKRNKDSKYQRRMAKLKDGVDKDTEIVTLAARATLLKRSKPPMKLDTAYFQNIVDETLWRILRELDDVKVASMSGRELASAAATLLERRAMLRGEPTQIIRSEQRGSLERVGELLIAELARRGKKLPGAAKLVEGKVLA